ncbi:peroxiredoxin [Pseudofrankia sp. BMG5.37]|nr:peroxiredoxin [Pseudofrankia sp. BMG5.37]MDT3442007.1 peroxiredoxin [Pseudofrankia sp. BMG5.37]MDT3442545.1 peroxiredoxin [Pseudofrankia sp. BMG5.37]MDT3446090.1 peroxiredoxin [Pseudofrankia sp. BMG5.37]
MTGRGVTVVFLVRRLLAMAGVGGRPHEIEVEIAVPRHQVAIVRRGVARPRIAGRRRHSIAHMLDPGARVPVFALPDQDGRLVASTALAGHWALLWWYPKAGSPGCTIEGQELRDQAEQFQAAGCLIVGLSFDTPEENKAWAEEQGFEFPLLSDVDHSVGRLFAVERDPDDQYAAFPLRVSYLVDPDGVVRKTYVVAGVQEHAVSVLSTLAELGRA